MKTLKIGRQHFSGIGKGKKLGHNHIVVYHPNGTKTTIKKVKSKISLVIKVNSPRNYEVFDDAKVFEGATTQKVKI